MGPVADSCAYRDREIRRAGRELSVLAVYGAGEAWRLSQAAQDVQATERVLAAKDAQAAHRCAGCARYPGCEGKAGCAGCAASVNIAG